jgi:intraflagellar transport protein 52
MESKHARDLGAGSAPGHVGLAKPQKSVILFDGSKRESHDPGRGFKKMYRRLRGSFDVKLNKEEIRAEKLAEASCVVFGGPREKFSSSEFHALKQYIDGGGSVMVMLGEGGEARFGTNINYLLEQYGMSVNSDCVVRTVYYKYLHPKEAFISNGVVNRAVASAATALGARSASSDKSGPSPFDSASKKLGGLEFVYPWGATVSVQHPATAVLSSGFIFYPLHRPVVAMHHDRKSGGKLVVCGGVEMFGDDYMAKEDNNKVCDILFSWLTGSGAGGSPYAGIDVKLEGAEVDDGDIGDYHYLPDTHALSEKLRSCLQESDPLPRDFTQLFDGDLFKFDTSLIPEAVKLYDALGVKHEPLSLIPPQFETPLPPLNPAVFPPTLRELAPPELDQFDLDEQFASERIRLAQLTNKCSDEDVEYYVREASEILGVTDSLTGRRTGKHLLHHILQQVVNWKKLNQEPEVGMEDDGMPEGRVSGIMAVYGDTLGAASSAAAGMGPAVAAGFHSNGPSPVKGMASP